MMNGKYKPTSPKPLEDMVVLIGNNAWDIWGNGKGEQWLFLNENI